MRETKLTIPEVGMIAGTRGLLGAGAALLLADRIPESRRKTVGWTMLSIGALTTSPLAFIVLSRSRRVRSVEKNVEHKRHGRTGTERTNGRAAPDVAGSAVR